MENEDLRVFVTEGYEDMELSTQILIKEALHRGIAVEILDRQENFIQMSKGSRTEFVKQATRTSADSYISALIMENKQVTKRVLANNNIAVPKGDLFYRYEAALTSRLIKEGRSLVVKPNNTNFGKGVSILKHGSRRQEFENALTLAFSYDNAVIVEEFFEGKEYRFLVIGNDVVGVLHRVAANVIGDGVHTIGQLIDIKNADPLRGSGYQRPLEKIRKEPAEIEFLAAAGMGVESIPKQHQMVFLRKNSNISTGGDSLDVTDEVDPSYKSLAVQAAQAVGATICGADIIIEDLTKRRTPDNYSIIELNFNPAIHIHNFPYQGKNRQVEKKILQLLGF
jgi:glutamate--cysteine ligase